MIPTTFFQPLENSRPYLKLAAEGFAGTGKTFTTALIAIGLHKKIHSDKPIVYYDTERSLKALKPLFDKSGINVLVRESRSLKDLVESIHLCEDGAADILVIDSITHVWESFVESYRREKKRTFIQFQDWGILKPKWKRDFSDNLVQSKLHILFTGRAGYEYDHEMNEATGKKELIKSGIKMKVENETEYEPDIVLLMEKLKEFNGNKLTLKRQCLVIKDRTTLIDGKVFSNPKYKDFSKAINLLLDGEHKDSEIVETSDTFEDYSKEIYMKKTAKEIALEEIQGVLVSLWPGQSAKEKKMKIDILDAVFNTTSWKAVEKSSLKTIEHGAVIFKRFKNDVLDYYKDCAEMGNDIDLNAIWDIIQNAVLSLGSPAVKKAS